MIHIYLFNMKKSYLYTFQCLSTVIEGKKMSQSKKRKRRKTTPRQELGIKLALKLGLPTICPLHNIEENQCKETGEDCFKPELDNESNIDYRLCDTFSAWFWNIVQKEEIEGLAPPKSVKQSPKTTSKEEKEENG